MVRSEENMEPHLVFAAGKKINHEFLLATIAMKAVKKMHCPGLRTEETANRVFAIVAKGQPMDMPAKLPAAEVVAPSVPEAGSKTGTKAGELRLWSEAPAVSSRAA